MRWLSAWRLPLLLAWRDAARAKGRSTLVLAMIALPVLAVTAALVVQATSSVDGVESLDRRLGAADARVVVQDGVGQVFHDFDPDRNSGSMGEETGPATLAEVREVLGADVPALEKRSLSLRVGTDKGVANAEGVETDLANPLTAGLVTLTSGRLPTGADEVVINQALADKGYAVGDRLEIVGDSGAGVSTLRTPTIVGLAESTSLRTYPFAAGPPGSLGSPERRTHTWLIGGGPVSWEQVRELNAIGATVLSRAVVTNPPPRTELPPELQFGYSSTDDALLAVLVLIVVMALLEVVLLAGPAFAVSARRQSRTLALLAAAGGSPAQARRVVLAGGVVLGGRPQRWAWCSASCSAGRWSRSSSAGRRSGSGRWTSPGSESLGVAAFGLASAVIAAIAPAWIASRQDVVAVLAGRRGDRAASLRSPILGLVLMAAGIGGALYGARQSGGGEIFIAASAILSVLGMILLVPVVLVALARVSGGLPLSLRYSVRDAARHRTRTVPAVAAVAATVAGVVALGIAITSDAAESKATYSASLPMGEGSLSGYGLDPARWSDLRVVAAEEAPGVSVTPVRGIPEEYGMPGSDHVTYRLSFREPGVRDELLTSYSSALGAAVLVSDEVPAILFGLRAEDRPRAEEALASGGIVVITDREVRSTEVRIRAQRKQGRRSEPLARVDAPATYVRWEEGYPPLQAVLSPGAARSLGVKPSTVALRLHGAEITEQQESDIQEAMSSITSDAGVYVERGYQNDEVTLIVQLILGALGGVLMLGGTLTATFLALSDARPDLATLSAIGASPRRRRGVAAAYALVVGLVGALLGAAVGFIPGLAVTYPLTGTMGGAYRPEGTTLPDHFIDVPWLMIATVVVALPLFTALVVGLLSRSRLPLVARLD